MLAISDIRKRNFNLCVVGLGRIGLPLALSFALQGVKVFGIDKRKEVLDTLNARNTPFQERGLRDALYKCLDSRMLVFAMEKEFEFKQCPVIIIAVGTPLKENLMPDMSLVYNVMSTVSKRAAEESIVILRSTLAPGTTQRLIFPHIEKADRNLHIAVCPERIVEDIA
jgi:UDP-N-acetyl-D-mannosaminuronic acid dehydrogenase